MWRLKLPMCPKNEHWRRTITNQPKHILIFPAAVDENDGPEEGAQADRDENSVLVVGIAAAAAAGREEPT